MHTVANPLCLLTLRNATISVQPSFFHTAGYLTCIRRVYSTTRDFFLFYLRPKDYHTLGWNPFSQQFTAQPPRLVYGRVQTALDLISRSACCGIPNTLRLFGLVPNPHAHSDDRAGWPFPPPALYSIVNGMPGRVYGNHLPTLLNRPGML